MRPRGSGKPTPHDLASFREAIPKEWKYAARAVELLADQPHEVFAVVTEGMRHRVSRYPDDHWTPATSRLVAAGTGYGGDNSEVLGKLMVAWRDAARAIGDDVQAWAAEVQRVALVSEHDWSAFLDALSAPPDRALRERFLDEWVGHVAASQPSWFEPLIRVVMGHAPFEIFEEAVAEAIAAVQGASRDLVDLARLTLDVDDGAISEDHPALRRALAVVCRDDRPDPARVSRQAALEVIEAGELVPELLALWEGQVMSLVPEPAGVHRFGYDRQALWLSAARELQPAAATELFQSWRQRFPLRRRLWKALEAEGWEL